MTLHATQSPLTRREGRGYQEGLHGCPDCGSILNGVYYEHGTAGYDKTLLMCPTAIGEQVSDGRKGHAFPRGSKHRRLVFYVAVGRELREYQSERLGHEYAYNQRKAGEHDD